MKDMAGVMAGFVEHVDPSLGAHLLLCGPAVTGVADDPEAAEVLDECTDVWRQLPHAARSRVHLACIPMADPDENAAIVNAIQRHASVVVQKSLAEGFGLTVAEAMWKRKAVVASAVGGIVDQIEDGTHGLLVRDPTDLEAFGAAVESLLRDREDAAQLGENGRRRVIDEFLGDRHLEQYGLLFEQLPQERLTRRPARIARCRPLRFLDQWVVRAPIDRVYDTIGDVLGYERWWTDFGIRATGKTATRAGEEERAPREGVPALQGQREGQAAAVRPSRTSRISTARASGRWRRRTARPWRRSTGGRPSTTRSFAA